MLQHINVVTDAHKDPGALSCSCLLIYLIKKHHAFTKADRSFAVNGDQATKGRSPRLMEFPNSGPRHHS